MTMRCATARRWMMDVVAAKLPQRRAVALRGHLDACPACREELRRTEALESALKALAVAPPIPPRVEAETLRRVRELRAQPAATPGGLRSWRWIAVGVPACATAMLVLLVARGLEQESVGARHARVVPSTAAPPTTDLPQPGTQRGARQRPAASQLARQERPDRGPVVAAPATATRGREVPDELLARPDLFVDLPLLTQMEKLEHFEAIVSVAPESAEQPNG